MEKDVDAATNVETSSNDLQSERLLLSLKIALSSAPCELLLQTLSENNAIRGRDYTGNQMKQWSNAKICNRSSGISFVDLLEKEMAPTLQNKLRKSVIMALHYNNNNSNISAQ